MAEWSQTPAAPLDIAGVRLDYACHGPAPDAAASIVMLHEGLGCVALWRDFPERLAAATGFGVMAYSRAGYGRSDPAPLPRPLDYMTREALDVLPPVLDAVGVRRGILLGHSDGATIAAIHAGRVARPCVRGLILMAPHFFTEARGLAAIAAARRAYEAGGLRAKLAKYHRDPDNAFYGWNDAWLDPGFRNWDVRGGLDTLRAPVLAIQGHGDEYGTLAQVEAVQTRSPAPVDVVILDDCGHAPHLEQPEATLAAITTFCAQLERAWDTPAGTA